MTSAPTSTRKPIRKPKRALTLAWLLGASAIAAQAQGSFVDPITGESPPAAFASFSAFDATPVDIDTLPDSVVDASVFRTLLPSTNVARRSVLASAISATLAATPGSSRPVVPTRTPAPGDAALRPIRLDAVAIAVAPAVVNLAGETVRFHADGLPAPNAASTDPFVRVLPRGVNPAEVAFGARWGAQDRIPAPVLSQIAWGAHADLLTGAPPARVGAVRRSLRLSAQWDDPEDFSIGVTPGVERTGGTFFEHYVAGLEASTVDKTQPARWHSFVEVSGEKLAPNNLIENATATVRAGATYSASSTTQFDVSVTRGTMAASDLQSNLGLTVHF